MNLDLSAKDWLTYVTNRVSLLQSTDEGTRETFVQTLVDATVALAKTSGQVEMQTVMGALMSCCVLVMISDP